MKYDFKKDDMIVQGRRFPLKPFRIWLGNNHPSLVQKNFVKAIHSGGKTKFTYDWQHIYHIAEEYGITHEYLKETYDYSSNY